MCLKCLKNHVNVTKVTGIYSNFKIDVFLNTSVHFERGVILINVTFCDAALYFRVVLMSFSRNSFYGSRSSTMTTNGEKKDVHNVRSHPRARVGVGGLGGNLGSYSAWRVNRSQLNCTEKKQIKKTEMKFIPPFGCTISRVCVSYITGTLN